jgi:hypothetical protein
MRLYCIKIITSDSCGVFVIMTALYWIRERRLPTTSDWTQNNIPALRLYIASIIFTNTEIPEYQNNFSDQNSTFVDLTRDNNENSNLFDI